MTKIDEWWSESKTPVNLHTIGRINFSGDWSAIDQRTSNKTLSREVIREIVEKHARIKILYDADTVQKAAIEDFVDDIVKKICGE